jgi:hypothetical protein
MHDETSDLIPVAALTLLLLDALQQEETEYLAGDPLMEELAALLTRVENRLDTAARRPRLRVV